VRDAWPWKRKAADVLRRVGLLQAGLRVYLVALGVVARVRDRASLPTTAPDGLPLPPPSLRIAVGAVARSGSRAASADYFLANGAEAAAILVRLLGRAGRSFEDCEAVLDFGCGCGRVTRHLRSFGLANLVGCDIDARAIEWCSRNLPFAQFQLTKVTPPLPQPNAAFDLVYAFSVFTHLPERLQRLWIDELRRVVRPAGFAVLSTHGERFLPRLSDEERRRFASGLPVELYTDEPGSALCSVYNPFSHVSTVLGHSLELIDHAPGAFDGQDVYLFRRPPSRGLAA